MKCAMAALARPSHDVPHCNMDYAHFLDADMK